MQRLEKHLCAALKKGLAGKSGPIPAGGGPIWSAFCRLSEARSWHANGPNPISYAEIEAYCRVAKMPLGPSHISIVRALDGIWVSDFYRRQNQGREGAPKTMPPVSDHPLTAALFDVVTI